MPMSGDGFSMSSRSKVSNVSFWGAEKEKNNPPALNLIEEWEKELKLTSLNERLVEQLCVSRTFTSLSSSLKLTRNQFFAAK